jgi:hypothetical protein
LPGFLKNKEGKTRQERIGNGNIRENLKKYLGR